MQSVFLLGHANISTGSERSYVRPHPQWAPNPCESVADLDIITKCQLSDRPYDPATDAAELIPLPNSHLPLTMGHPCAAQNYTLPTTERASLLPIIGRPPRWL
jgi:hypothetical protein